MNTKARFRLTELVVAVTLVAAALAWAERVAWRQISRLREDLSAAQIARFRSVEALRAAILETHETWRRNLRQITDTGGRDWEAHSGRVMEILTQIREPHAGVESELLRKLGAEFESYVELARPEAAASDSGSRIREKEQEMEQRLDQLLALSSELAVLNEAAAENFCRNAQSTLARLQRFLFLALLGLLGCGAVVILLIYRRTIAPLRSNLTESRAIIDRQEKLASLCVLAAGIAHEIRNPLTAIKVRLFTLRATANAGSSDNEDLEVIEKEINRLEQIVRDFLQFARPAELDLQRMLAGDLLRDTATLLTADLEKKSIRLNLEIGANEPLQVDPGKMKQVLLNFIQNAADSMEGGGTVTLRSTLDRQVLHGQAVPVVILDIVDTGKGMPPEVQKRLFDPFFTTKEKGTGLGLPISARIVEKHGGVIQYQTEPDRGTTFSIVLPLAIKDENES